jgi:hypothetical protein
MPYYKKKKNPANAVDNVKKIVEIIPTLTNDDIYRAIKDLKAEINNVDLANEAFASRINYLVKDIQIRLLAIEKANKPWYKKIYWNIVNLWEKSTR